jgi:hypothetical protein
MVQNTKTTFGVVLNLEPILFSKLHAAAEAAGQHCAGHGRGVEEDDQHHQRTQQVIFSLAITLQN